MDFRHSGEIWRDFPELVPGIVFADGITHDVAGGDRAARFTAIARSRLAGATEGELPEIRAWRRAFTRMGLDPTQYRCASEALLRRLRKDGTLPPLHPLVDVCNAVSAAFRGPGGRLRRLQDRRRLAGTVRRRRRRLPDVLRPDRASPAPAR